MFKNAVRFLSRTPKSVVFDIDGVLIKGGRQIPQARPALELLDKNRVPFVLLTNGGGVKESDRIEYLSDLIHYKFRNDQIVQSHTPMKELIHKHPNVMVVGGVGNRARECAESYGFESVVTPVDLVRFNPHVAPFNRYTEEDLKTLARPFDGRPIDAIMVFNDPRDMSTDLQVIMDLLNSDKGQFGTHRKSKGPVPAVPIYFSNNDFYWANEFSLPRFGQGVFRIIIETVYKEINRGANLHYTMFGKPFKVQYDYCAKLLSSDQIFMVGDNPLSDIEGANNYGWESCLVKTGVYKPGDVTKDPTMGVFDDVYGAVSAILANEGYSPK
ncbi:hypothetical protein PSN45_001891 [Yamadazyma tenuis]|nr:hypothetical protein PSN45_001891 [Yamadazyma tenuis]